MKTICIFISSVQREFSEERLALRDWLCNARGVVTEVIINAGVHCYYTSTRVQVMLFADVWWFVAFPA